MRPSLLFPLIASVSLAACGPLSYDLEVTSSPDASQWTVKLRNEGASHIGWDVCSTHTLLWTGGENVLGANLGGPDCRRPMRWIEPHASALEVFAAPPCGSGRQIAMDIWLDPIGNERVLLGDHPGLPYPCQ